MTLWRRRDLDENRAEMLVSFLLPESPRQVDAKAAGSWGGGGPHGWAQRESVGE